MKIFISHAISDKKLIQQIKLTLEPHGITLLIAEHFIDLQHTITEKIEEMIDSCDVALVLLTESGFNSTFVQQEIGYIQKAGKPFLQVVQTGLVEKISGFNFGREYITLNPENPDAAIGQVRSAILEHWRKTEEEEARKKHEEQKQIEEKRRQASSAIVIAIGLLLLFALLSTNK